jgi:hypothetical protein
MATDDKALFPSMLGISKNGSGVIVGSYDAATTVINIDSDDTNYWHTATGHGSYDAATTVKFVSSESMLMTVVVAS